MKQRRAARQKRALRTGPARRKNLTTPGCHRILSEPFFTPPLRTDPHTHAHAHTDAANKQTKRHYDIRTRGQREPKEANVFAYISRPLSRRAVPRLSPHAQKKKKKEKRVSSNAIPSICFFKNFSSIRTRGSVCYSTNRPHHDEVPNCSSLSLLHSPVPLQHNWWGTPHPVNVSVSHVIDTVTDSLEDPTAQHKNGLAESSWAVSRNFRFSC